MKRAKATSDKLQNGSRMYRLGKLHAELIGGECEAVDRHEFTGDIEWNGTNGRTIVTNYKGDIVHFY